MDIKQYAMRGIQLFIALIFIIFSISHFSMNHIGQNLINFTTVLIFIIGLDNIIIFYGQYFNKQSF
jgi:hypothetical protein